MEIQPDYGFVTNKPTKRHDYIITKEELDEVGSVIEQVLSQYINNKDLIDDNFEEAVIDYLNKYKNKYDEIGVSRSKMVEEAIINTLFNLVSITGGDEVESIVKKLESEFGYTETFFSIYKIHHLKFFNNSLHYISEKYFNDINESRKINKLYTSINEFKSGLNHSGKKRRFVKNERFTRAKNYKLTIYCDTSINDPYDFVEWLDYQDVALVSGFSYNREEIYKTFNSYDEAFEVITWIIEGMKGLDEDGVEPDGSSEDIVTGFEIISIN